ncbi:MAG: DUF2442 domain-containing protein [bacterium]
MRNETESTQDFAPGVIPCAPWRVVEVHTLADYRLFVRFSDDTTGEVDLSRLVAGGNAGIFAALRDPALFAQVYVEYGAVVWPGEIDLAPDAMYDEIKKLGRWVPE